MQIKVVNKLKWLSSSYLNFFANEILVVPTPFPFFDAYFCAYQILLFVIVKHAMTYALVMWYIHVW